MDTITIFLFLYSCFTTFYIAYTTACSCRILYNGLCFVLGCLHSITKKICKRASATSVNNEPLIK